MVNNLDHCIVSFCDGDNNSIIPLYKRWSKELYFISYRYVRNHEEAEDIVAEVFEKLISMPPSRRRKKFIEQGIEIGSLLVVVVKNKSLDKIRVRDNRKRILDSIQHLLPTTSQNGALNRFSQDFVESLFLILPERERQILKMTLDGYNRDEIASTFDVSQKTVSNSLTNSRNKLKQLLKEFR